MTRRELPAMIALAERIVNAGVAGTLATLFSTRGSSYRPLGSMMVGTPGMHVGGVSGGCLEEYVARESVTLTQRQPVAVMSFATDPDADDRKPVLGCGGSIEVVVERMTPAHVALLRELAAAYDADAPSLLACRLDVSGETPSVGRQWLPATGALPAGLARIAADVHRERKSRQASLGPGHAALVHWVPPLTRLVIFGAGDDAWPVADLGRALGWHVTVADRRARLARASRFPDADAVIADDWEEAVRAIPFTPRTVVVLMTHSLPDDAHVLSLLADRDLAYLGALGPPQRRQWLLDEAATYRPGPSRALAERLRGPIGLDLGDRSAAGIAVAVVAEVLAALNERSARPLGVPERAAVPELRVVSRG